MAQETPLSTRIDTPCRCCPGQYRLVEPTDALAARPVQVEVRCVDCGHHTFITLSDAGRFESGRARPSSSSSLRSPSVSPETSPSLRPTPVRYTAATTSGVNLASRYSMRAPALDTSEERVEGPEAERGRPTGASSTGTGSTDASGPKRSAG